jgi:cell division protein FtsB
VSARVAAKPQDAQVRRRVRLSARGAMLGIAVSLVLLAAIAPARNLIQQRAQLAHLRQQTVDLQRRNDSLQAQVAQLGDPAYLEKLARQCLGMVKPGEVAFVTIPRHGAPVPPDC